MKKRYKGAVFVQECVCDNTLLSRLRTLMCMTYKSNLLAKNIIFLIPVCIVTPIRSFWHAFQVWGCKKKLMSWAKYAFRERFQHRNKPNRQTFKRFHRKLKTIGSNCASCHDSCTYTYSRISEVGNISIS